MRLLIVPLLHLNTICIPRSPSLPLSPFPPSLSLDPSLPFPPPPQLPSTTSEEEEEEPSDLHLEGERLADVLASYQERIHGVVSDWMDHYREHIGIQPRSLVGSNITSLSPTRATSSQGRRIKSSMSFIYGQSTCKAAYVHCTGCRKLASVI